MPKTNTKPRRMMNVQVHLVSEEAEDVLVTVTVSDIAYGHLGDRPNKTLIFAGDGSNKSNRSFLSFKEQIKSIIHRCFANL